MLENGSVLIHRSITAWEWYKNIPTRVLFEHLILTANWKESKYKGVTISRGERVCSYPSLAQETGLTEKQVRTALQHLKETGEVTVKGQAKYSIVSVQNYSQYQLEGRHEGRQRAGKGQAKGREINKANKANKAINNKHIGARARAYEENTDLSFALSRYVESIGRDANTPAVELLKSFLGYNPESEIELLQKAAEEKTAIRSVTNSLIRLKGGTE